MCEYPILLFFCFWEIESLVVLVNVWSRSRNYQGLNCTQSKHPLLWSNHGYQDGYKHLGLIQFQCTGHHRMKRLLMPGDRDSSSKYKMLLHCSSVACKQYWPKEIFGRRINLLCTVQSKISLEAKKPSTDL